jgi:short subunit dehydrogenase-like uncharacterized protein
MPIRQAEMNPFLLYGSYGYTGQLIADLAVRQGLSPILSGRNEEKLKAQAAKLGLPYRAFPLSDAAAMDSALREVQAVVHAAGPFVHTFRQMAEACLRTGRHYVDISGEIAGFEALAALDAQARAAGVMLMPGAGFDVVPSDCLAAHLKSRLPSATRLRLFIRGVGAGISRGTATSGIENMERGGMIRREGKLVRVPLAWKTPRVDFGRGPVQTVLIGWGDVSTAYHSTGIPNIEVYMVLPRTLVRAASLANGVMPVLRTRPVKSLLRKALRLFPPGPSEERRQRSMAILLGEVTDEAGGRAVSRLETREGYTLTAMTAVEIARRILSGYHAPGFQTPSRAYGADFILGFDGTRRDDVQ